MFAKVMGIVLLMCTLAISISVLCVLIVQGMHVMVYLTSVMSPPSDLVKLCTLGDFALGVILVFLSVMIYVCVL